MTPTYQLWSQCILRHQEVGTACGRRTSVPAEIVEVGEEGEDEVLLEGREEDIPGAVEHIPGGWNGQTP